MTFKDVVGAVHDPAIDRITERATISNRLAKSTRNYGDRLRFYERKNAALSRLIVLGAGRIEELLLEQGLATIALKNRRRLHIPLSELSSEAKAVVQTMLSSWLTAA